MSDILPSDSRTNAAEFTVSEISGALKRAVEDQFGNVRVRGEISGYRGPHSSGHAYFALKDERARLEAVIWKGTFSRLKFRPEEGMEVIASGKLTTYPGSSKYQIVIDNIEPAGAGALMALLEERRRRLAGEGLFDEGRKQLLPYMPRVVGVVTSPTGAVIRDIIHRITDRFPIHVLVWPVRVQGETTGAEVSAAVEGFNALDPLGPIPRPDVLIVARGGGSLEDLWGFNDEAVVRAVAASDIPVISAVGHETDWTLIDHAADIRAPTPTGAAEIAVPVKAELEATLASLAARLRGCVSRHADRKRQALRAAARALPSPDQLLALPRRRFDEAASRLVRALASGTEAKRLHLRGLRLSPSVLQRRVAEARRRLDRDGARVSPAALSRRLDAHRQSLRVLERHGDASLDRSAERRVARLHRAELRLRIEPIEEKLRARRRRLEQADRLLRSVSYQSILDRGFALVTDATGEIVRRAETVARGDALTIEFTDGKVAAIAAGGDAPKPKARPAAKPEKGGQGSLF
ncbi:exodeoxyribonuclease VII large subunit [Mesorhizobium microcysteis]|uniref:Exodeoxyribonuclease 7 large subunit n=1 Tax=Neoaquamicrobium microcysteis TaxID=2682781 RepID=A0A5D4GVU9_9HYPH|nr:exodeoxyribonuclease VII large subunit [Mesorhizobium microcysteis]TYR32033.1 exodeoxyribonuclease VII large subunit [Mesorhizobium microcysteis]